MSSETVIREVFGYSASSSPFARFGLVPFGGRSTAIRLQNGDVFVFVSTPLIPETKAKIDELGTVQYLVAPDAVHNLFISEFMTAYPQAKCIGVEPLVEKKKDVKWAGVYGVDPPGTLYGFEPEIQACYFSGFANKDVCFLHAPSKTLVVADLLFNLPAHEQFSKTKSSGSFLFASSLQPYAPFHKRFLGSQTKDKAAMKADADTVAAWDFDRIIMCHGDVIEKDAKKAWTTAYEWIMKG